MRTNPEANPVNMAALSGTRYSWPSCSKSSPRAVSSVGSERLVYTQEVGSSNLPPPTWLPSGLSKRILAGVCRGMKDVGR